jgi:hypothetical protein
MTRQFTVDEIVELIDEIDRGDGIDWAQLKIDESQAVRLIANNILDHYQTDWQQLSEEDKVLSMLSTMTYLVVENFVLNLRLTQRNEG